MELMQIQEEESYQPFEIEQKLKEAQKSKIKALTKQLSHKNSNKNLKRTLADMSQKKIYEKTGNSRRGSQLANRETESETEPASQGQDKPKLDDAQVKQILDARKEQKFFEKEYNKDMKKIRDRENLEKSIQDLRVNDPSNPQIQKIQKKLDGTKKPDIYEQFTYDEIDVYEFMDKVKLKNSKQTGRNKKTLTQSRIQLASKSIIEDRQNEEQKDEKLPGMVNLADILADLDDEKPDENSESEKLSKGVKRNELNQTT